MRRITLCFILGLVFAPLSNPGLYADDLSFVPLEQLELSYAVPDIDELDVLVIGESPHFGAELPAALAECLLPQLVNNGFELYMREMNHADGWIANRYVVGEAGADQLPPWFMDRDLYDAIRTLNSDRATPLRVRGIDLNHAPWSFSVAMRVFAQSGELPPVVMSAVNAQFGGLGSPPVPSAAANRAGVRDLWIEWVREGSVHRFEYANALGRAVDQLSEDGLANYPGMGEAGFGELLELLEVELESVEYRYNGRAAQRERVMFEIAVRGITQTDGPVVVHAGIDHAERSPSNPNGNRGVTTTLGRQLAREYATHHMFAYGLSGRRLANSLDDRVLEFDHRSVWPDENLMTRLGAVAEVPGLITFSETYGSRRIDFGIYDVRPHDHWDSVLVFPVVSIHRFLRP